MPGRYSNQRLRYDILVDDDVWFLIANMDRLEEDMLFLCRKFCPEELFAVGLDAILLPTLERIDSVEQP